MNSLLNLIEPYISLVFTFILNSASKLNDTLKTAVEEALQKTFSALPAPIAVLAAPAVSSIVDFIFANADALTPEIVNAAETLLQSLLRIGIAYLTGEWTSDESKAAIRILVDDLKANGETLIAQAEVAGEKIPAELSQAFKGTLGALPGAVLSIFGL